MTLALAFHLLSCIFIYLAGKYSMIQPKDMFGRYTKQGWF